VEAEKKVLGACIRDREAVIRCREILGAADFLEPKHRILFSAIIELLEQGIPVDLITLHERLFRRNEVDPAGGPFYMAELVCSVATSANVEYHAQIVREKSVRRRIMLEASEDLEIASTEDISTMSLRFLKRFQGVQNYMPGAGAVPVSRILPGVVQHTKEQIQDALEGKVVTKSVTTGLADLDHFTGGMDRGEMVVLAARPSEGKTALACRIAFEAARQGKTVLFMSLETSKDMLTQRILCGVAHFSLQDLMEGRVLASHVGQIDVARNQMENLPLYIDDGNGNPLGRNVESILARCEKFRMSHPCLDLIVIDYLQLMRTASRTATTRYEQITEISNHCQMLPIRLDCPLLLLSQLSRDLEKEKRADPRMSDLRDSGAIEQDAHQIWFLSREKKTQLGDIGPRKLTVAKNKNGKTGCLRLQFMPQYLWFENYTDAEGESWMNEDLDDSPLPF
jgi:replicative DNA helicase